MRVTVPAVLAIVVAAAVAVLSSPLSSRWTFSSSPATLVTPSTSVVPTTTGGSGATSPSTTIPASPTGAMPDSAVLAVLQGGSVAVLALFHAGTEGGVVLGMPGVTLLRSGDDFIVLADAFSPSDPANLARPVDDAFGVSKSAVASIDWSSLRSALASSTKEVTLPESLDPRGADAGAVAAVLAEASRGAAAQSGGSGGWWRETALAGEGDDFRAALTAEVKTAGDLPWTGQALTGALVAYGNGTFYLEPDVQKARSFLDVAGPQPGSAAGK